MVDSLETLTMQYWATVQRVRRLPVPLVDKLIVLADVEVICLRGEKAAQSGRTSRRTPFVNSSRGTCDEFSLPHFAQILRLIGPKPLSRGEAHDLPDQPACPNLAEDRARVGAADREAPDAA